jgi:hypothetical protein
MAEIVKPHPRYLRIGVQLQEFLRYGLRMKRAAIEATAHEFVGIVSRAELEPQTRLLGSVLAQRLDREHRQRDGSSRPLGFWFSELQAGLRLLEGAADRQGRVIEIDVAPLKPQYFSSTQTGSDGECHRQRKKTACLSGRDADPKGKNSMAATAAIRGLFRQLSPR